MCSGLYKNYRSGACGCKWLRLRHRKYNLTTPYDNTNTKIFLNFFYLIRFLRSGQRTKRRASAPGCKWLELHHRFCQLMVLRYHTNPNLFLKFFYHLRFLRSDWHKILPPVSGEKKEKKEKKRAPKNEKLGKFSETRPKTFWALFDKKNFFASKTSCHACENSKSRTEVRDLTSHLRD